VEVALKFLELVRVPFRYVFGAFVANVLFLFSPNRYLTALGVLKYRETERAYFGLLFFVLLAIIIAAVVDAGAGTARYYRFLRSARKRLHSLTLEEKQILAAYLARGTRTLYLSVQSGVVKGLVHENIIYRSSNVNNAEYGALAFAHNMQPWAWDYLNDHPEVLTGDAQS
jgi:Super-infection exclusion protein B